MFDRSYTQLVQVMALWDNRLRLQQTIHWAPRGLVAGLSISLALALVARFFPLFQPTMLWFIMGGAALGGLLVATLLVWLWRRPPLGMARNFDLIFGLRERMSTAVELSEGYLAVQSSALARLQIDDAFEVAQQVEPATGLPLKFVPREWLAVALVAATVAAAILVPNRQTAILQEQQAVEAAIDEELERLEALRDEVEEDPTLDEQTREDISEILTQSIESLQQPGVTREEAVEEMAEAEMQLLDLSEQNRNQAIQSEQALDDVANQLGAERLTEQIGNALDEGDYDTAAELLENLLDPNGQPLTEAERQLASQQLALSAEQLRDSNPELAESLANAGEEIANGDQQSAQEALSEAAQELAEAGEQIEQNQDASQAAQAAANAMSSGQESVAQAGQEGQEGQEGQDGQQPGEGQGGEMALNPLDGGASGQDSVPVSVAGEGTGDGSEQEGSVSTGLVTTDNQPGQDAEREFESVFAPQRIGGEGGPEVNLPGEGDPGNTPVTEGEATDNPEGEALVPYSEVYGQYSDAANEALDSEYVPLSMRDLIRAYFSSLNPNN